jgi:hypothetical protein
MSQQRAKGQLHLVDQARLKMYIAYARLTSGQRVLPDYLMIGVQKGGSSSLHHYINQHPQVIKALKKEIHFFDQSYDKGVDWYRSHFPKANKMTDSKVTGDFSPYYIFHPLVPKRVHDLLPEVKLIVLLRNPIDRAYSQYHHNVRRGREKRSFEDAINGEVERIELQEEKIIANPRHSLYIHQHTSYLSRGMYARQISRWLKFFPREQFLILQSETLFRLPEEVYQEVLAFLGLSPWRPSEFPQKNVGRYEQLSSSTRQKLERFYEVENQKLYAMIGRTFDW